MMNQEIVSFLKAALECSVLVSPLDPGLTVAELLEIGKGAGYQNGEVNDALQFVTTAYLGAPKLLPSEQEAASWVFLQPEEPEYRNFAAFDFVVEELNAMTRAEGGARAAIARDVLVERAIAKGIPRNDIEVAITWQALPGRTWRGTVERKPSSIQALGSRQVGEVVCSIDNPGRDLVPGTNVDAEIQTAVVNNALVVPRESLGHDATGDYVFILHEGTVERRAVKTGASSIALVQVADGLAEGDSIALPTDVPLSHGTRVTPAS